MLRSMKSLAKLQFGSGTYSGESQYDEASMGSFYDLTANDIDDNELPFNAFKGKVSLITNVGMYSSIHQFTHTLISHTRTHCANP